MRGVGIVPETVSRTPPAHAGPCIAVARITRSHTEAV